MSIVERVMLEKRADEIVDLLLDQVFLLAFEYSFSEDQIQCGRELVFDLLETWQAEDR